MARAGYSTIAAGGGAAEAQAGGDLACCGPSGSACCEQAEGEAQVNWSYVGDGRGSYEQVDQYNFVGQGTGSYQMEEVTTYYGCRLRVCCLVLLAVILLGIGVLAVVFIPRPEAVTTPAPIIITTTPRRDIVTLPTTTTTSLPYDCDEDYHDCYHCLRVRWSYAKRHWCCAHVGRGCSTTTTEVWFDCNAGFSNWEAGWSEEKQAWCCARHHRACPTTTPCPHPR